MPLDEYYTIEEVADKLKVTRQAIHKWIKAGRLESVKAGRARRIPRTAVERLLHEGGTSPFTAVFEQQPDGWWIAYVEELPGANTQGQTLEEARENLQDAVQLVIETRRDHMRREAQGRPVRREPLRIVV